MIKLRVNVVILTLIHISVLKQLGWTMIKIILIECLWFPVSVLKSVKTSSQKLLV